MEHVVPEGGDLKRGVYASYYLSLYFLDICSNFVGVYSHGFVFFLYCHTCIPTFVPLV